MFAVKVIISLCFLFFNALPAMQHHIGLRIFHKELIDPGLRTTYVDTYNGHSRLSYVKSIDRDFFVVIETYVDGLTFRKSCWTTFEPLNHEEQVRVVALDKHKVVFMRTTGISQLNIYLVDTKSCEWRNVTELIVNMPYTRSFDRNVFVIPYSNLFDVMYSNFDTCKKRLCKLSYDFEGGQLGNGTFLMDDTYDPSVKKTHGGEHFPHFVPISRDNFAKGYFMFVEDDEGTLKIKTLSARGEVSNSVAADVEPRSAAGGGRGRAFAVSSGHDSFGYCWVLERAAHCRGYDLALNLRLNLSWPIGHEAGGAALRNLPDGSFLLLTHEPDQRRHYLTHVRPDGRRSDPLELGLPCAPRLLYQRPDGDFFCSFGDCAPPRPDADLVLDVHCVPAAYFHPD